MLYQPVKPFSVTRAASRFWRIVGARLGVLRLGHADRRCLENLRPGELEDLGLGRRGGGGHRLDM